MRIVLALALCAVLASGVAGQDPQSFIGSASELYTNLTLIDGRGGPPQPNSAILVWNGRIRSAGARSSMQVPQGTRIVDLEGAFVVPGYIDVHAAPRDSATLASMLSAGITGVREATMPLDRFVTLGRRSLADGPLPTVFIGGPILEGPQGTGGLSILSPGDIDAVVHRLVREDHAEFVSVAESVPAEWVRDIARAARRGDAPVWVEARTRGWLMSLRMGADVAAGLVSLDPDLVGEATREAYDATLTRSPTAALGEWLELLDPRGPEVETAISALLSRDAAVIPLLATTEAPVRCVSAGEGCGGRSEAERAEVLGRWPIALEFMRVRRPVPPRNGIARRGRDFSAGSVVHGDEERRHRLEGATPAGHDRGGQGGRFPHSGRRSDRRHSKRPPDPGDRTRRTGLGAPPGGWFSTDQIPVAVCRGGQDFCYITLAAALIPASREVPDYRSLEARFSSRE